MFKIVPPIGPFKVIEKDANTYELEDLGMKKLGVIGCVLWVKCQSELDEGKLYKGKIAFHPHFSLKLKELPEFIPE